MKYALFPGCKIAFERPDLELAMREVLTALDVPFEYLSDFSCCPTWASVPSFDIEAWLAISARNISLAEKGGLDIVVGCGDCYSVLNHARDMLRREEWRERVNRILAKVGRVYRGTAKIYHIIHLLEERKIKKNLKHRLNGFVAGVQPGCHLLWPAKIFDAEEENPFFPERLKKLVEAMGAETPHYSRLEYCCGNHIDIVDYEKFLDFVQLKLQSLKEEIDPDFIVTACSTCFIQLDEGQKRLKRLGRIDYEIPVFHFPQLLAICLGSNPEKVARISSVDRNKIISEILEGRE